MIFAVRPGVTMGQHQHARAELQVLGHRGDEGRCREGLEEGVRRASRKRVAMGRRGLEGRGHVIGDEDRLEAARLRFPRHQDQVLAGGERAVAGEMPAEFHFAVCA